MTRYRNTETGQVVALSAAEDARFFDNRDPAEWVRVGDKDSILSSHARILRAFVTDEVEG